MIMKAFITRKFTQLLILNTFHSRSWEATAMSSKNIVAFSFNFKDSNYDFSEYLNTVITQLNRIKKDNGTMYYSAKDIPVFHFFQCKELTAFKVYYWLKTMSNNKTELTNSKFSFDM